MEFMFTAKVKCQQLVVLYLYCPNRAEFSDIFNTLDETEREARERARRHFQRLGWFVTENQLACRCPDHN